MGCSSSSAALSCCPEKQYVQDKVCTPWSGTGDTAEVVIELFTNNVSQNIFASGYLQYDVGPQPITFEILDSLGVSLYSATLAPGTSTTFTYRRFGSIQVTLPAAAVGGFQGEFCITTRYSV